MTSGELQALLGEDRWIRRLARRLVHDASAADDLVQDAWAAALASDEPPRAPRAWLAGIVRNLWRDRARSHARRERRECAAAHDEALPSSAELAAEIELRRRVAEAVLALEEPLRRTLALRYFQDRTLQAIAEAEGVAVSTVHERERRALERLRVALDRAHGEHRDPRRAWAATMITLARPSPAGATAGAATPAAAATTSAATTGALEVLAMAGVAKIAAAAVLALGAGAAWWWSARDEEGERAARPEVAAAPVAPAEPAVAAVAEPPLPEREALAASTGAGEAEPAAARAAVEGRVVDATGRSAGSVTLAWRGAPGEDATARSAADGSFRLEHAAGEPIEDRRIECVDPDLVTLVAGTSLGRWTVAVAPAATFAGRVVDEAGAPVEGAELEFRPRESVFRAAGVHARIFDEDGWSAASDGSGRFHLEHVAGGEAGVLRARATGYRDREVDLPARSELGLVVLLERPRHVVELVGTVLDPAGRPVPGANVSAGREIVTTDGAGRFSLPWSGGTGHFTRGEDGVFREESARSVVALKTSYLPAVEPLGERDLAVPLVLQLGPAPLAIAGTLRDATGGPAAGIVLWLRDPTRFGREPRTTDDGSEWNDDRHVEEMLCRPSSPAAITDEAGRFELGCLMDREYTVLAFDPRTSARAGPWKLAAGSEGVDLVFAGEPAVRVAGRVVTARGLPRAGMRIEPRRSGGWEKGAEPPQLHGAEFGTETDAEGRFEFPALAVSDTKLFYAGGYTFGEVALAEFDDLEDVEIVEPELCEVQVELADPALADRVEALDAAGERLETCEVTGMENGIMIGMGTSAELVDGRSRLLLIKETARAIVLTKDGEEVLRMPVELVPGERTVLRP